VGAKAAVSGRLPDPADPRRPLHTVRRQSWLVGVQLLDGVGAGIYGAIFTIIVADLMRGTGRFSSALGAVNIAQGIGAALSTTLAGIVVVHAGYSAAFITLAAVAAAGLLLFYFGMPETRAKEEETEDADPQDGNCHLLPVALYGNLRYGRKPAECMQALYDDVRLLIVP
jgi:MFS family permease